MSKDGQKTDKKSNIGRMIQRGVLSAVFLLCAGASAHHEAFDPLPAADPDAKAYGAQMMVFDAQGFRQFVQNHDLLREEFETFQRRHEDMMAKVGADNFWRAFAREVAHDRNGRFPPSFGMSTQELEQLDAFVNNPVFDNNCYSYAVDNNVENNAETGLDPGAESGNPLLHALYYMGYNYKLKDLIAAAESDGLQFLGRNVSAEDMVQDGRHLVSLHYEHGTGQYHWARQNADGTWSHKPGLTDVTNVDSDGRVITDPRTANFNVEGIRYRFVGFMLAPDMDLNQTQRELDASVDKTRERLEKERDKNPIGFEMSRRLF